jgi:hypothetical protein
MTRKNGVEEKTGIDMEGEDRADCYEAWYNAGQRGVVGGCSDSFQEQVQVTYSTCKERL